MNRRCVDCGCVWTPACPTWAAIVCVVVGIAILVACGLIAAIPFVYEGSAPQAHFLIGFGAIGFAVVGYGIAVLRGNAGAETILHSGQK